MTKRELRRAMREQKRALRQQLAAQRRAAKAQLANNPALRKARTRKQIRRAIGLAAVVLLLLLVRCDCAPAPQPVAEAVPAVEKPEPTPPAPTAPVKAKPGPLNGRIPSQPRAKFQNELAAPPSWLEEFRLQVAARSPRLAQCFTGTDRPGALRWSAAVNGQSGAVSDHELEPVGAVASMDSKQRECVLAALSRPTYRLPPVATNGETPTLPNRISMVIEF